MNKDTLELLGLPHTKCITCNKEVILFDHKTLGYSCPNEEFTGNANDFHVLKCSKCNRLDTAVTYINNTVLCYSCTMLHTK